LSYCDTTYLFFWVMVSSGCVRQVIWWKKNTSRYSWKLKHKDTRQNLTEIFCRFAFSLLCFLLFRFFCMLDRTSTKSANRKQITIANQHRTCCFEVLRWIFSYFCHYHLNCCRFILTCTPCTTWWVLLTACAVLYFHNSNFFTSCSNSNICQPLHVRKLMVTRNFPTISFSVNADIDFLGFVANHTCFRCIPMAMIPFIYSIQIFESDKTTQFDSAKVQRGPYLNDVYLYTDNSGCVCE